MLFQKGIGQVIVLLVFKVCFDDARQVKVELLIASYFRLGNFFQISIFAYLQAPTFNARHSASPTKYLRFDGSFSLANRSAIMIFDIATLSYK